MLNVFFKGTCNIIYIIKFYVIYNNIKFFINIWDSYFYLCEIIHIFSTIYIYRGLYAYISTIKKNGFNLSKFLYLKFVWPPPDKILQTSNFYLSF